VIDGTRQVAPARARRATAGLVERVRRTPAALAVLLALALVQALAWSVTTAPFNGPDEPAHIAYAQYLAETGHGPSMSTGTASVSTELGVAEYELNLVPSFGRSNGRATWSALARVSRKLDGLPKALRKNGSGPNAVAQNPPLYYAYEALAYRLSPNQSLLGRVFAMRVANGLLYLVTIGLMWLLAGEIFTRPWVRFLATAIVALHPKLASLAGNVNPDTLLVTLTTGFLLAGVKLVRGGPTSARIAGVAGTAGLAALTHGRGLFLLPVALLVLAVAWLRARPPRRALLRQVALGGGLLVGCLLVAFLWTRSDAGGAAFGGEVGRATNQGFNVRQFASHVWQFYLPHFSFMAPMLGPKYGYREVYIETFFGGYANFEVNFRPAIYDWLQIFAFGGFVAIYGLIIVRWRSLVARWPLILLFAATFAALLTLLHISSYRHLQVGGDPLITGRYLLPCIALFGLTIAWVTSALPRRIAPWAGAVVLAGFVLLDVEGFLINAQRFYG
jgi:predicted membrane protein DUF2142